MVNNELYTGLSTENVDTLKIPGLYKQSIDDNDTLQVYLQSVNIFIKRLKDKYAL